MNLIDEQFTRTPFYGVPKMTFWLRRQGHPINPKRVRRLMRFMDLEAVYPKKRLSKSCPEHRKYPYLLRGLKIDHPDQVWCADITYIRMYHGFIYLMAVMDWFSRYVLAWELSITISPLEENNIQISMDGRGGSTTASSSRDSGELSSTKRCIFMTTQAFQKPAFA